LPKSTHLIQVSTIPIRSHFFYFALYIIVLIRYSTTVLYLSIRLLLVASTCEINVIVIVCFWYNKRNLLATLGLHH